MLHANPTNPGISPGSTAEFSVQAIGSGLGLVRIGISCGDAEDGVLVNLPMTEGQAFYKKKLA